jgi:hypothetical protein
VSDAAVSAGSAIQRGRWLRPAGIAVSVALVALAIVFAAQGGGADRPAPADASPHLADADDLAALEGSLGHPLYWVGTRDGDDLEVSEEADGSVYLRYLPAGVEAGDPRQRFLTVGTYPVASAAAALRRSAASEGGRIELVANGGVVLLTPASPHSAYLAYPGSGLQVEVYEPQPGRALELIRAGAIRPVG